MADRGRVPRSLRGFALVASALLVVLPAAVAAAATASRPSASTPALGAADVVLAVVVGLAVLLFGVAAAISLGRPPGPRALPGGDSVPAVGADR
jgi:hypothetical protein